MSDIKITRISGGGATPNGDSVFINVETEAGPTRLLISAAEAQRLPIAAMQAVSDAESRRAGRGTFVYRAEDIRLREDRATPGLLSIKFFGAARPMFFELTQKAIEQIAEQIKTMRKKPPVSPAPAAKQ